ncbi:hypothetical protein, partial [Granulicatella balaenopterae]
VFGMIKEINYPDIVIEIDGKLISLSYPHLSKKTAFWLSMYDTYNDHNYVLFDTQAHEIIMYDDGNELFLEELHDVIYEDYPENQFDVIDDEAIALADKWEKEREEKKRREIDLELAKKYSLKKEDPEEIFETITKEELKHLLDINDSNNSNETIIVGFNTEI